MAVTVTEVARISNTTSSATKGTTYGSALAAGRTVVVFIDAPTGGTNTSVTVTDSKGNTYTTAEAVFSNAYAPAVATCQLTSSVTTSDTLTVTLGVNSQAWNVVAFDVGVVGSVDVSGNFPSDGATHASPAVSTSAAATANGQIVMAAFANSNTTHTFTAGSGFTAAPGGVAQTGTGSGAIQMWVEWREYTTGSGGVRSAGGTYATAANYAAVVVAINVTPGGGGGGGGWAPTEVGRTIDTTSSTTKTITLTTGVAAGHHLVLLADIPSGTPITTATAASTGNTWTPKVVQGDANFAAVIITCIVATAMTAGQNVTVTISNNSAAWKMVLLDLGAVGAVDVTGLQVAGTTTASPSVTTSGNAAINHQYALALFSNSNTTHAFAVGSGYTALPGGALTTGTGASSNNMWVEYREFTSGSGATRTADGTFATAGNYAAAIVVVNADAITNTFAYIGGAWVPTVRLTWSGSAWI